MKAGEAPLLLGYGPFFGHQLVDPLAEHEQLQQRLERQLGRRLQQQLVQQHQRRAPRSDGQRE